MKKNERGIIPQEKNERPLTPGFGVAGFVICPFMSITHPAACVKSGCELWVELNCGGKFVARCSLSWISVLSTEVRGSIDKLAGKTDKEK